MIEKPWSHFIPMINSSKCQTWLHFTVFSSRHFCASLKKDVVSPLALQLEPPKVCCGSTRSRRTQCLQGFTGAGQAEPRRGRIGWCTGRKPNRCYIFFTSYHRNSRKCTKTLLVAECHSNKPHDSWMVVLLCLLIEIELEWLMISSKVITHGVVQPEYWNIPLKDWGAILKAKVPQGLPRASTVCQYHLFLSLVASLPRIMLILGGPDGISDSVRETMRKVLDAWLIRELARLPCFEIIGSIFWRCPLVYWIWEHLCDSLLIISTGNVWERLLDYIFLLGSLWKGTRPTTARCIWCLYRLWSPVKLPTSPFPYFPYLQSPKKKGTTFTHGPGKVHWLSIAGCSFAWWHPPLLLRLGNGSWHQQKGMQPFQHLCFLIGTQEALPTSQMKCMMLSWGILRKWYSLPGWWWMDGPCWWRGFLKILAKWKHRDLLC